MLKSNLCPGQLSFQFFYFSDELRKVQSEMNIGPVASMLIYSHRDS